MDTMEKAGLVSIKARLQVVAGMFCIGIFLAALLAPALAARRPLPAPIVETVRVYSADVLDIGVACLYTWGGAVFYWSRANIGIGTRQKCPSEQAAQFQYTQSRQAPIAWDPPVK